jgi:hypothetical protein
LGIAINNSYLHVNIPSLLPKTLDFKNVTASGRIGFVYTQKSELGILSKIGENFELHKKKGMVQFKVTLFPKPIGCLTKISDDLREVKEFVLM